MKELDQLRGRGGPCRPELKAQEGWLRLAATNTGVKKLLAITGLTQVLGGYPASPRRSRASSSPCQNRGMTAIEQRLASLGMVLPAPAAAPPGVTFSFGWVRVRAPCRGLRPFASGRRRYSERPVRQGAIRGLPCGGDAGSAAYGSVGALGSVKRAIGDLDRIAAWISVTGMVNADSGYWPDHQRHQWVL